MAQSAALFTERDVVYRTSDPDTTGIVARVEWNPHSERWDYVVAFAGRQVRVQENMLRSALNRAALDAWDMLCDGQARGRDHLAAALTHHRLQRPAARIADSYVGARTEFYPHQFKPLLKFLDNPDKRILIGDDVGLGKTIEAGYIMLELDAHERLDHVLVLVPARLRTKWKKELENRFGESFEIVRKREIVAMLSRVQIGRPQDPFRWIVSYESIRGQDVRMLLETTQPLLGLLIVDEAHRLRNPKTEQHKVGRELCDVADAVVFLSATPIQNKIDDLFYLLRLLNPDDFRYLGSFKQLAAANEPLLRAQLALRRPSIVWEEVILHLRGFDYTDAGNVLRDSSLRRDVERRIREQPTTRAELVELQTDIGRLSPLGHIYSRTRKGEAIPNRAMRRAQWIAVPLSDEERDIYHDVESLYTWAGGDAAWGQEMAMMMVYRMTASCIPAAIEYFRERRRKHLKDFLSELEANDEDRTADGVEDVAAAEDGRATDESLVDRVIRDAAERLRLPAKDSKFEAFDEALRRIWQQDTAASQAPRKVVVFSYFRRTVEYLARRLTSAEIECRVIHGGIDVESREQAIDEFLDDRTVRVLVTSDVGGEGIDLQRAAVIVNYDLPWNPMVVEQRIGRLDRIGQQSECIDILNLVAAGSIEETILSRLLTKIGIFETTLGELDPIVGDEFNLEALARDVLFGKKSREAVAKSVEEAADAFLLQVSAARQMLARVDDMLIADQGIIDEIHAVIGERQIPLAHELLRFVNQTIARRHLGLILEPAAATSVITADFRNTNLGAAMEASGKPTADTQIFSRRSQATQINLTFSREAAYRHPRCELFHLRHPVVRYAMRIFSEDFGHSPSPVLVELRDGEVLLPGRYVFHVEALELIGFRRSHRLAVVIVDITTKRVVAGEEALRVLFAVCDAGADMTLPQLSPPELRAAAEVAESALSAHANEIEVRERKLDEARAEQQRARTIGNLEHRARAARAKVASLRARPDVRDHVLKAAETRLKKLTSDLHDLKTSPLQTLWQGIQREEVIKGLIIARR